MLIVVREEEEIIRAFCQNSTVRSTDIQACDCYSSPVTVLQAFCFFQVCY